ncbi:MAG: radical SAM protein [Spirochaetales bacterium]|nr:radical SAM protein [Spirochaetales bacterium]
MSQFAFNYAQLTMLLRIFFFTALKTAIKNPRTAFSFLKTILGLGRAAGKREKMLRLGVRVPPIIILSITERCNLACKGCYARALHEVPKTELTPERLYRLVDEADKAGVSFFVVAGGEPFLKPELLDIAERFRNIVFLVFTNGLLLDTALVKRLRRTPNIVPLLSLEGGEKETDERRGPGVHRSLLSIMEALKRNNVFFGASLTLTRANFPVLTGEDFVRDLTVRGMRIVLMVEFTPVDPGTEHLTVTQAQRRDLAEKMRRFRRTLPAVFVNLPQDEEEAGGCLAAGRGFVHISAQGAVEPCPFSPFSDSNIRSVSLVEALRSPLLARLREHPDELHETGGGCVLWQKREWVNGLLQSLYADRKSVREPEPVVSNLRNCREKVRQF